MGKVFGVFTLIIGGIIVADILSHPNGTKSAATGVSQILTPSYNALLGGPRGGNP